MSASSSIAVGFTVGCSLDVCEHPNRARSAGIRSHIRAMTTSLTKRDVVGREAQPLLEQRQ